MIRLLRPWEQNSNIQLWYPHLLVAGTTSEVDNGQMQHHIGANFEPWKAY
jgi:hypothetical protein